MTIGGWPGQYCYRDLIRVQLYPREHRKSVVYLLANFFGKIS